jgi:prepilin peptidase CpaA
MILDLARVFLFPALMAFAAASDLFTMTIPNRVSLLLVAGFFILAGFSGMPLADIAMHTGAGLTVLVIAFACFAFGWIGGGDAKVAAAAGLWFGFPPLASYLVYASLFGGALTLLMLSSGSGHCPTRWFRRNGCSGFTARTAAFPMASHSPWARS